MLLDSLNLSWIVWMKFAVIVRTFWLKEKWHILLTCNLSCFKICLLLSLNMSLFNIMKASFLLLRYILHYSFKENSIVNKYGLHHSKIQLYTFVRNEHSHNKFISLCGLCEMLCTKLVLIKHSRSFIIQTKIR